MIAKSFFALALGALVAACSARGDSAPEGAVAAVAEPDSRPSIYALVAQQQYTLLDVPADLVTVADSSHPGQTRSLLEGVVIGAWTTAPTAAGEPAALVYHCQAGARDGTSTWAVLPDAELAPLGLSPAQIATALPFTASHVEVVPPLLFDDYFDAPSGPAWNVDSQLDPAQEIGVLLEPPWTLAVESAHTQLIGAVEAQADSPNKNAVPLYRYRKSTGVESCYLGGSTVDRAEYVLRLDTQGGLGPGDEGAPCTAGSADVRSVFSADFYFITLPATTP